MPLTALARPGTAAEVGLEDLPGGVSRQLADEVDVARELERGEPWAQPGAELIGPSHGALGEYQPGRAGLAPPLVGHADDRGLGHVGMLVEHVLDLGGVHVLAAADVHVLDPVDDPDPA